MKNKFIYLILASFALIGGCSQKSESTPPSDNGVLDVVAPSTFFSGVSIPGGMPVIVYNNTSSEVAVSYSYKINNVGLNVESIPTNCNTIAAKGFCQLNIPIAQSTLSGAAEISASYSPVGSSTKSTAFSSLISFQPLPNNLNSGSAGVTLFAAPAVMAGAGDTTSNTDFIVTAVNGFNNTIQFNTVTLIDSNGNPLSNVQNLSGQDGTNNIAAGGVMTFLVKLPAGTQSQAIGLSVSTSALSNPQLLKVNGINGANDIQTSVKVLDSNIDTDGVMVQATNNTVFNLNHTTQEVYVGNIGVKAIKNIKVPTVTNLTISANTCQGATLQPGDVCSYTINFDNSLPVAGKANIVVTYDDELETGKSDAVVVSYVGTNPTVAVDSSKLNNFVTTQGQSASQDVTLTNVGQTSVTPVLPTLTNPAFTISAPANGTYCYSGSVTLATAESCSFALNYSNNAKAAGNYSIDLNFTYNGGVDTYTTQLLATYKTTLTSASLQVIYPQAGSALVTFDNILNNGMDESSVLLSIYNSGSGSASDIAFNTTDASGLFNYTTTSVTNPCGATLAAGESCNVFVTFGPTEVNTANTGTFNSIININYTSNSELPVSITPINLNGTVITPNSANISRTPAFTGTTFTAGGGTIYDPYVVIQNKPSPIVTYTITNTSPYNDATAFAVKLASADWKLLSSGTCYGLNTLKANQSCTIDLSLTSTASTGSFPFNMNNITVSWADKAHSSNSQQLSGTFYARVALPTTITVNSFGDYFNGFNNASDGSSLVTAGSSSIIEFTVSGLPASTDKLTITPTVINGLGSATISTASCIISNNAPRCRVMVDVDSNNLIGAGDFTVSVAVSNPDLVPAPAPISYHTWAGTLPDQNIMIAQQAVVGYGNYLYVAASNYKNTDAGGNVYKCSALSNGNLYACVPPPTNGGSSLAYAIAMSFADGYAYIGKTNDNRTFSILTTCQVNATTGELSNCIASNLTHVAPINEISGMSSMSVANEKLYLLPSSAGGLWTCNLISERFNQRFDINNCSKSTVDNSSFSGVGSILVSGNSLLVTQQTNLKYLNKCTLDDNGIVTGCATQETSYVDGFFPAFQYVNTSNALLVENGYLYGSRSEKSVLASVCPFANGVLAGDACISATPSGSGLVNSSISIGYMNGWFYSTSTNLVNGQKSQQNPSNGQLVNVSDAIDF